jgi:MFS family permease
MASRSEAPETPAPSAAATGAQRAGRPVAAPRRSGLRESLSVLALRDFRFLLLGNAMMFAGFQVRNMGQAWLVLDLTNDSALWVGIVNAMPGIAIIFFSLLAGAAADRSERWKIQVITKFIISAMAFVTAVLVTVDAIEPWHLIPIGLAMGIAFAFHNPASQTFAMDVVGRERLMAAVSLNTTVSQSANIIGPFIGGVLLAAGLETAFYLLGVLYGVGFLATLLMRTRSKPSTRPRRKVTQEISEGLRYAMKDNVIKWLLFIAAGGIFTGIFQAVTPLFAKNILDVGGIGYGTMSAVQGAGSLAGSFALVLLGDVKRKGLLIFGGMLTLNVGMVIFALSDIYALSLAMLFFIGMGMGVWFITVPTLIQTRTEDQMRGRVMSIFFMVALIFQLGWLLGGALDTLVGTRVTTLIAAGGAMTMVVTAFAVSRDLRKLT